VSEKKADDDSKILKHLSLNSDRDSLLFIVLDGSRQTSDLLVEGRDGVDESHALSVLETKKR
jgi:hypothetical protein